MGVSKTILKSISPGAGEHEVDECSHIVDVDRALKVAVGALGSGQTLKHDVDECSHVVDVNY